MIIQHIGTLYQLKYSQNKIEANKVCFQILFQQVTKTQTSRLESEVMKLLGDQSKISSP